MIQERLLRQEVDCEPQEFVVAPKDGVLVADDSGEVPDDGYLCFLDPSSKLPSNLLANRVSDRVRSLAKIEGDKELKVILIRGQISKLSKEVSLKKSLVLILGCDKSAAEMLESQDTTFKRIDTKAIKPKVIELRRQMDPSSLAE